MSQSENLVCINRIKDELERHIKQQDYNDPNLSVKIDQLSRLAVNYEELRDSKIGQIVNSIRKSTSDVSLQKTCKSLIKKWYLLVENKSTANDENVNDSTGESGSVSKNAPTSQKPASSKNEASPSSDSKSKTTINDGQSRESPSKNNRDSKSGSEKSHAATPADRKRPIDASKTTTDTSKITSANHTANSGSSDNHRTALVDSINKKIIDPVRKACLMMILTALDKNSVSTAKINPILAEEIEQAIYQLFGVSNIKYKNCVRSRVFNLKDTANTLCSRVVSGQIMPSELAKMTSEEMASESLKKINHEIHMNAVSEHSLAKVVGTYADSFKCGKCGKKNCTYTQAQTRSSDEPMTTFVTCMECGNRWKFS